QPSMVIQVSAAINRSNSGGPAVGGGKMVGLVFSRLDEAENIGYINHPPRGGRLPPSPPAAQARRQGGRNGRDQLPDPGEPCLLDRITLLLLTRHTPLMVVCPQ